MMVAIPVTATAELGTSQAIDRMPSISRALLIPVRQTDVDS